ncbi:FliM/FliN family flagellar motor C-terminal domain-containing protein [Planctomycetota bacterium]
MSGKAAPNLSKERINQLLAVIGSEPKEDAVQEEATEYNWHEPRYFSSQQLVKLDDFTKRMAKAVAEKFSGFCRNPFDVTITSTTLHYACEFLKNTSEGECKDFYLLFGTDQEQPCGFIGMPEQTAVVWARQLLGDSESEKESNVTLSQLEKSLLLDLTSALIEAFSSLYASTNFRPKGSLLEDQWPLKVHDTEELCKISFDVKKAGSEDRSSAYLLIFCEELNSVVGKVIQASDTFSAEEISKTLLNYLQGMSVAITAQLVSTELTFEEITTLQVNDILLLDKKVNEPVDLIINGRTVYYGWPVKSAGRYAVTIASKAPEDTS